MKILVLNSGSSSQKCSLYEVSGSLPEHPPVPLWQAEMDWGTDVELRVKTAQGRETSNQIKVSSHRTALEHLLERLWTGSKRVIAAPDEIGVVGHRVVHGGREYVSPVVVTPAVKQTIQRLAVFAPLHNPAALEGMKVIESKLGSVPQVAAFDTAFHAHLPLPAAVYPGPYEWLEQGIRRYGFHGINHRYCAQRAAQILGKDLNSLRLIVCHLGNGCSLAAVEHGRSVETTMGFTPLEGLMMGTRSGSVDPGILTYLLRQDSITAGKLDDILNTKSGLLGVSGVSGDMREILAAMNNGDSRAKLAFDIYIHRLRFYIGAMLAVLGGSDALVFTAGVGENSAAVRAAACTTLEFTGLKLDPEKNSMPSSDHDRDVAAPESSMRILVVRAQEDWAIARACWQLLHD
ncbi:MAG: acetate kinase [Terriglobia bacterium]